MQLCTDKAIDRRYTMFAESNQRKADEIFFGMKVNRPDKTTQKEKEQKQ